MMKEWPAYLKHDASPEERAAVPEEDMGIDYWFWCEGCETNHKFRTKASKGSNPQPVWTFNGNMEKPTFGPSLRYFHPAHKNPDGKQIAEKTTCHLFLEDGLLRYLDDCPHILAGKSKIPLQEMPW